VRVGKNARRSGEMICRDLDWDMEGYLKMQYRDYYARFLWVGGD